jgi:L-cystine uptake protein TcyP (sodium:dicarboxylate symporter family)
MVKMVWAIMEMVPYAVFALMAWLTLSRGSRPRCLANTSSPHRRDLQTFIVVSIFVALIARSTCSSTSGRSTT